jgi:hypothetical protein
VTCSASARQRPAPPALIDRVRRQSIPATSTPTRSG